MNIYVYPNIIWAIFLLFNSYRFFRKSKNKTTNSQERLQGRPLAIFAFLFNLAGVIVVWLLITNWPDPPVPEDGGPPGPGEGFGYLFFLFGIYFLLMLLDFLISLVGFCLAEIKRAWLFLGLGIGQLLWLSMFYLVYIFLSQRLKESASNRTCITHSTINAKSVFNCIAVQFS